MSRKALKVGPVEAVVFYPGGLSKKVRSLGGMLSKPSEDGEEHLAQMPYAEPNPATADLQKRVDAIEWYHTIDLGNGVVTPGWFDLRGELDKYPLPARMDGMRVLDVATFDGFWAFEFARRGADVVALDIESFSSVDMSPRIRRTKTQEYLERKTGEGFALAREVLNLPVHREICNVYDLSPERLGMFDFVFVSDLLLHLMNPMKALNNMCSVTKGHAVIAEVYDARLPENEKLMYYEGGEVHNTWWSLSFGALQQMVIDAGFRKVELTNRFMTCYRGQRAVLPHASFRATP